MKLITPSINNINPNKGTEMKSITLDINNNNIKPEDCVEKTEILGKRYKGKIEAKTTVGLNRSINLASDLAHNDLIGLYAISNQMDINKEMKLKLNLMANHKGATLICRETMYWITEGRAYIKGRDYSSTKEIQRLTEEGLIKRYTEPEYTKGKAIEAEVVKFKKGLTNELLKVISYYVETPTTLIIDDIQKKYAPTLDRVYHKDPLKQTRSMEAAVAYYTAQNKDRSEKFIRLVFRVSRLKMRQELEGTSKEFIESLVEDLCPKYQKTRRETLLIKALDKYGFEDAHTMIQENKEREGKDINEEDELSKFGVFPNTSLKETLKETDNDKDQNQNKDEDKDDETDSVDNHLSARSENPELTMMISVDTSLGEVEVEADYGFTGDAVEDSEADSNVTDSNVGVFQNTSLKETSTATSLTNAISPTTLTARACPSSPVLSDDDSLTPRMEVGNVNLLVPNDATSYSELRDRAASILSAESDYVNHCYNEALLQGVLTYAPVDLTDVRQQKEMTSKGPLPFEYRLLSPASPRVYGRGVDNLFYSRKEMRLSSMEGLGFMDVDLENCHANIVLSLWGDELPQLSTCLNQGSLWNYYQELFESKGLPFYKGLIKAMHHATFLGGGNNAYMKALVRYNCLNPHEPIDDQVFLKIRKVFKDSKVCKELKNLYKKLENEWAGNTLTCPTGESFYIKKTNWAMINKCKKEGKSYANYEGNFSSAMSALLQSIEVTLVSYLIVRCQALFVPILWQHDGITIKALYSNTVDLMQLVVNEFCDGYLGGQRMRLTQECL